MFQKIFSLWKLITKPIIKSNQEEYNCDFVQLSQDHYLQFLPFEKSEHSSQKYGLQLSSESDDIMLQIAEQN
jgi:hypothetical protein